MMMQHLALTISGVFNAMYVYKIYQHLQKGHNSTYHIHCYVCSTTFKEITSYEYRLSRQDTNAYTLLVHWGKLAESKE